MSKPQPLPSVVIDTYKDEYQPAFAALNYAWIEKYFSVEPPDRLQLDHPRRHIVEPGGEIFLLFEDGAPKGACAMLKVDERTFELTKMGVDPSAQGRGYAQRLMEAAIAFASRRGAERIVLRSHTSLRNAIAIYRKFGFVVTQLGRDEEYARCDIHMALDLRAPREVSATPADETLDPVDWEPFRALAHRMVDDSVDYLARVRERPTWQRPPAEVQEALQSPAPWAGQGAQATYDEFLQRVRPYTTGNISPRFWGWVQGSGAPVGVLADFLASVMNPNASDFNHSPALVEMQVIDWFREIMGFPKGSGGLLVSGGSAANLTALTVARNAMNPEVRERGVDASQGRLTLYASREVHSSIRKAAELLGLGEQGLRLVTTLPDYSIDIDELTRLLAHDRAQGLKPFCVVGTAGTVNTGAIDPLDALADLCAREKLWFHVDGAFGALAMLSPALRPDVAGVQRADSVIFDFHKWLYAPYEAACVLVRAGEAHRRSFSVIPPYLAELEGGIANAPIRFSEYGVQLSRGFRALKIWMALKADGFGKYSRLIEQNVAQARYLTGLVNAHPRLELMAPTRLNIVNFRYRRPGLDAAALDALNERILIALQESGFAVPSSTVLDGRFTIRCAIVNHRSTRADFEALAKEVVRLGDAERPAA
ncbi:MAG TPA: GNAT family N-acetyltransferase [Steroidobacteraceae bacterium]|nr:GNAT family N-acetyltransferase [Steroidobacteraceae bacterium]